MLINKNIAKYFIIPFFYIYITFEKKEVKMKNLKTIVSIMAFVPAVVFAQQTTTGTTDAPMPPHVKHAHGQHMPKHMPHACKSDVAYINEFNAQMMKMHMDMEALRHAHGQDEAFLKGMIPHHQGAIAMAETLKKYSKDKELLTLADNIISSQQKEVKLMEQMLKDIKTDTTANIKKAIIKYDAAMKIMHQDMFNYCNYTNSVDKAFLAGMIPHHQGAIEMAKIYLEYGNNPQLKSLCNEIIKAQTQEIKFMKDKLNS